MNETEIGRRSLGTYSTKVGDATVTVLLDGMIEAPLDIIVNIPQEAAKAALDRHFRAVPVQIAISAFLVELDDERTLIDTGAGTLFGPTAGHVPALLRAIGVEPDSIARVALTHIHSDHAGGVLDAAGRPAYPNSELVIGEAEAAYWRNPAAGDASNAMAALARAMTAAYGERLRLLPPGEVARGIELVPLPGHTPGHSGCRITSGDDALLIWGDVVHVPGIQLAHPEASLAFDVDPALAWQTRARVFDMAASERLHVAGMHLEFPTFAHVARDGAGYRLVPDAWRPEAPA
ncbi:MAG TPA: MBL fold metallo-hydrolase [Acetobacteraceae bacterium]|nr:MBL fold metallo-hydrolase [Acetobacteraceae bacterium]